MAHSHRLWPAKDQLHGEYLQAVLGSDLTYRQIARLSKVAKSTLGNYRYELPDNIRRFRDVLRVLGYDLAIVKRRK